MRQLKITQQITNRSGKTMEAYLREVNLLPMVTPDEEVQLAKRIREGDQQALERLVSANLRFVISVAKQYQHYGFELEDVINEGNIGLIEAARRFDETRGFKFISYAVWWIRQSILKAISEKTKSIRIPANRLKLASEIAQAAMKIEQAHERVATEEEIGDLLDINRRDIRILMELTMKQGSLDAPVSVEDSKYSVGDMLEDKNVPVPETKLMADSLDIEIEAALSVLDEKEKKIIRLAFGLDGIYPKPIEDIAADLEISKERVRQLKIRALKRLRQTKHMNDLKEYL